MNMDAMLDQATDVKRCLATTRNVLADAVGVRVWDTAARARDDAHCLCLAVADDLNADPRDRVPGMERAGFRASLGLPALPVIRAPRHGGPRAPLDAAEHERLADDLKVCQRALACIQAAVPQRSLLRRSADRVLRRLVTLRSALDADAWRHVGIKPYFGRCSAEAALAELYDDPPRYDGRGDVLPP